MVAKAGQGGPPPPPPKVQLGQALFHDKTLSNPAGVACSTCHADPKAFTDPRPGPTSAGAVHGLFGPRNAPSVGYATYSPTFRILTGEIGGALGGQFWDGRAATLHDQVQGPLLNPVEMNNASAQAVVDTVKAGPSASLMKQVYGANVFNNTTTAFNDIADAIVAWEESPQPSPFTSKFDFYLKGTVPLTFQEQAGMELFNGKANCASCHFSKSSGTVPPLFTNYEYFNLGVPKNPNNPYYTIPAKYNSAGKNFVDHGLKGTTNRSIDDGKFLTPTLRNIALTGPYFHNGFITTLPGAVSFLNSRATGAYGSPEVDKNIDNRTGNLGLTSTEQADLVAFLNTLTDGFQP